MKNKWNAIVTKMEFWHTLISFWPTVRRDYGWSQVWGPRWKTEKSFNRIGVLENMDLTWKSIFFDLPRGVLSFAVWSSIDYLPTFSNLRTWGKRSQTKCKLCGYYEALLHVLNNCTVSLNQGRYTWRHNYILKHMLTALKSFLEPTNNDLSLFSAL